MANNTATLPNDWEDDVLRRYVNAATDLLRESACMKLRHAYDQVEDEIGKGVKDLLRQFGVTNQDHVRKLFKGKHINFRQLFTACHLYNIEPADLDWSTLRTLRRAAHIQALDHVRHKLLRKSPDLPLGENDYESFLALVKKVGIVPWKDAYKIRKVDDRAIKKHLNVVMAEASDQTGRKIVIPNAKYLNDLLKEWFEPYDCCDGALKIMEPLRHACHT